MEKAGFEELMTQFVLKLIQDTNPQINKQYENTNKTTSKHIIKLSKLKGKKEMKRKPIKLDLKNSQECRPYMDRFKQTLKIIYDSILVI